MRNIYPANACHSTGAAPAGPIEYYPGNLPGLGWSAGKVQGVASRDVEEVFERLMERGEAYAYLSRNPVPVVSGAELEELAKELDLVFVYFTAEWCSPCIRLMPELLKASLSTRGAKARIVRVDVDRDHELAHRYRVERLPTLIVLRKGRVIDSVSGAQAPGALKAFIESYARSLSSR
jgi:thiol-disulfide isomerase/thioredoxin